MLKCTSLLAVMLLMITCSCNDKTVPVTPKTLKDYIELANKTGEPAHDFYIGLLYYKGAKGATKDLKKARMWFAKAANKGYANGINNLAYMYFEGLGGTKDQKEAIRLYEQAAKLEAPQAIRQMGWVYLNGIVVDKSLDKSIEWYKKGAIKNDPVCFANLGEIYCQKKEYKKAREYCRRAAYKGNTYAMIKLGWLNVTGKCGKKDIAKGIRLYKKALNKGNKSVLVQLGNAYCSKENFAEARKYYLEGAAHGDSFCKNVLGTMNLWGMGKPADYSKAKEWYLKAVEQNNPLSMMWLGRIYEYGYGVDINVEKAKDWYKKGVALNSPPSMNALALLYFKKGKIQEAENLIKRIHENYPESYLDTYAYLLYHKGEYQKALRILNEYYMKYKEAFLTRKYLGDVYFKLKDHKKAKKNWQEALELLKKDNPKDPMKHSYIKEIENEIKKL